MTTESRPPLPLSHSITGRRANALVGFALLVVALSLGFVLAGSSLPGRCVPMPEATDRTMATWLWIELWATVLAGGAGAVLAVMSLRRGARVSAGVAVLTVGLLAASTHVPVKALASGLTDMPRAYSWSGRFSLITFGLATVLWSLANWWQLRQRLRAHRAGLRLEAKLARCLRRAGGCQWAAALLAACPAGVLAALVVAVPTTILTLLRTDMARDHFALPLLLTTAGLILLTVLLSIVAGLLCLGLVFLGRRVRLAGWMTVIAGISAGGGMLGAFSATLGNDLSHLSVVCLQLVIPTAVALVYGTAAAYCLLAQADRVREIRRCGDWLSIMARAILLFPLLRLGGVGVGNPHRRRGRIGWVLLVGVLSVLAVVLPPLPLEGTGMLVDELVSLLLVLGAVLLGYLLSPRLHRWKQVGATGLLVAGSLAVLYIPTRDIALTETLAWKANPTGAHGLRLVKCMLLLRRAPEQMPPGWVPPKLLSAPTKRTAVMEDLKRKRPLIVLVIWDACQGDRLSVTGYRRTKPPLDPTTPHLDEIRDDLIRFRGTFTQGASTTASLRNFFTGRYSSRWMERTEGIAPFWTNHLIRHGYHTFHLNLISDTDVHGISCEAFFRDMPDDLRRNATTTKCVHDRKMSEKEQPHSAPKAVASRPAELKDKFVLIECNRAYDPHAVRDALRFLETQKETKGRGALVMVHLDLPHTPWSRFNGVLWYGDDDPDVYDHTVRASDMITGKLIDGMKELGLWDEAIFILIADHGLHLVGGGSHPTHDRTHVPLLMKIPGMGGRDIDTVTALLDVGPTLVDIFEPAAMETFEGRSLWPLMLEQQTWDDRIVFGLSAFSDCYFHASNDGRYFVRHRGMHREELYNWRTDPHAQRNLIRKDMFNAWHSRVLMDWFLHVHGAKRNYALDRSAYGRDAESLP